jgi:hypothetical protein
MSSPASDDPSSLTAAKEGSAGSPTGTRLSRAQSLTVQPLSNSNHALLVTFLVFMIAIYYIIFCNAVTAMSFGAGGFYFYDYFKKYESIGYYLLAFAAMSGIFMWVIDCEWWSNRWMVAFRAVMVSLLSFAVFIGACFLVNEYPYGPLCLYLLCLPAFLVVLYWSFLSRFMGSKNFTGALALPMLIVSICGIIAWIIWVNNNENWSDRTREIYAQGGWHEYGMLCAGGPIYNGTKTTGREDDLIAMYAGEKGHLIHRDGRQKWMNSGKSYWYRVQHPKPYDVTILDYEDDKGDTVIDDDYWKVASKVVDDDTYMDCLTPFLMWASPFIAALGTLFYACIAYFLDDKKSHNAPKSFGYILMFLAFGLWCAASLSGAGSGVTDAFFAFLFFAVIGLGFMVVGSFGLNGVMEEAQHGDFVVEMKQKYGGYENVFKGLFVVTCSPLFLIYVAIAFLNQMMRRAACCVCTRKFQHRDDAKLWVTRTCYQQIMNALKWEWTAVITYANYFGAAAMILNVIIAKYVLIFLAWLIDICAQIMVACDGFSLGMFVVTLIILFVGLILFLLPPVPGVPIYLTGGMVLVASGTNNAPDALSNGGMAGGGLAGVGLSIVYTCFISLMLKIFACTCQQKLIGERMKTNAGIKQMVGINSKLIRTMKVVLMKPGLTIAKCAILIGGPDWPTSVLCGILGLDLFPIIIGTLPVFALIVPTVLAGSFAYLGGGPATCCSDTAVPDDCIDSGDDTYDENFECPNPGIWDSTLTLATVFSALAAGVQTGSMFVAAYYLEQAVAEATKDGAGLPPIDEEVRQLDSKADARAKRYLEEQKFHTLSTFHKINLIFGVICMVIANYMTMLVGSSCFHPFALGESLSSLPTKATWFFLIKVPFGSVSMIFFILALISMFIFDRMMKVRMQESIEREPLVIVNKIYDGEDDVEKEGEVKNESL